MGAAFWFAAAMYVRHGPETSFTSDTTSAVLMAASPLIVAPALYVGLRLTGSRDPVFACSVITATALLLDGLAIRYKPDMYGRHVTNGAAWIMFGAGTGLACSIVWPDEWM